MKQILTEGQVVLIKEKTEIKEPQFTQEWRDKYYGKEVTVMQSWVDPFSNEEYFNTFEELPDCEWSIIDVQKEEIK